ncbi:MAG: 30S ribosomal protein S3ae [Euryarchaeota archaeon]|jgi:small subunit ribosomal protein S3Ae|nr:30S ribosomal protein S3ae [Euryarchaeota archaeon]
MAKARARTTTRKVKDRWKAKNWYTILAPSLFNNVPVAETLAETPESLIGRVTEVSLQDITNDFRKSHIKLLFSIDKVEQNTAHTQLKGHLLTSDYLRRMIRRRKSRVDGVFDVETRDGALLRVKPFAIAEKRIQSSQKKLIRNVMNEVISKEGKAKTLNSFIKDCLDGKIGSEIYKHCKIYYPVKRIEVNKTEIMRLPTVIIEDEKPVEKPEEQPQEPTKEESEVPTEEEITEEKPETETPAEEKEVPAEEELAAEDLEKTEKPKKKTKAKTATKKKTTTKKTAKKKKEESPES